MKAFIDKANDLVTEMTKFAQAPRTLKEYSGWMSSFQASRYEEQLEIPGACFDVKFNKGHQRSYNQESK